MLRIGTRVPKVGFAVAKLPAEWGFGCENWEFLRFGISQPFCSCEMRVTVLRNGTRVPKVGFAAAKHPAKLGIFMLWSFAAVSQLRNGGSCAAKWHSSAKSWFTAAKIFAQKGLRL